ncbi:hypothetical protein HUT03_04035 [Candidatus Liberibacter africanus]|uniref:Uncharacterized protein n=1 Tax=Candidatus Liberibacter africanus PTSAPSY TaxID=1277257 RepID=A0A0G3I5B5_LIBAF|nr:hypothetical protein [Candidatus Liberibacter africanus]AKK20420.1 hypothetical protein G293_03980 [Candidatus Liberibacter africanus PTSAPSY]QTP64146.1 hypothetical protein HUT03_04035 [Candidatus Liberibacter africanus]
MFAVRKKDSLETEITRNICCRIDEISKILSNKSQDISEQELRMKIYLVTARIIALTAFREGKEHYILKSFKKNDSLLAQTIIQEINTLQCKSKALKNNS